MSNQITKLTIAAVLAGATSVAAASPGGGIRLGGSEGRLHPYVELEGRYDDNVYGGYGTSVPAVGDMILHVRPGLTLSVPGDMTSVDLGARLDWAQYLGKTAADGYDTSDLSRLYADAQLGISVNKKGTVGLEVNDSFVRSDHPQALSFSVGTVSNYNDLSVRVPLRPGGGALTVSLNGGWSLESYELPITTNCDLLPRDPICDVNKAGYTQLGGGADLSWKFLPHTAAVLEGGYFARTPNDAAVAAANSGDPGIYRIQAGVTGLVTTHVAATLKAGYGATSGSTGRYDSLGTWLATAECEWLPTEAASVKLGYTHDLAVDPQALYSTNRLALTAKQLVAGRFAVGLNASWDLLGYAASTGAPSGSETTTILQASPFVDVEVTRWLKAELAYAYTDRSSTSLAPSHGADYSKNELWLKAVATY